LTICPNSASFDLCVAIICSGHPYPPRVAGKGPCPNGFVLTRIPKSAAPGPRLQLQPPPVLQVASFFQKHPSDVDGPRPNTRVTPRRKWVRFDESPNRTRRPPFTLSLKMGSFFQIPTSDDCQNRIPNSDVPQMASFLQKSPSAFIGGHFISSGPRANTNL
jgi:hypothetical protein